jgi:hypothetical protein
MVPYEGTGKEYIDGSVVGFGVRPTKGLEVGWMYLCADARP